MNHLVIIAGPTAAGKTELAIRIAQHLNTEIISADSRQFYSEISIGTSKPTEEQLSRVKHYFAGNLSIHNDYNAGLFEKEALQCMETIFRSHQTAVMVGGSGLYLKAASEGFDSLPQKDAELRAQLESELETRGLAALGEKLKTLDPEFYETVDRSNPQRVIRAIEICLISGMKYSELRKNSNIRERDFSVLKIGLSMDRKELYARIDKRVDEMMLLGLLQEASGLLPLRHLNALQTVGYTELFDHLEGKTSLETAVELIKRNTRRFAKRQMTWFKRDPEIHWFQPQQEDEIIRLIEEKIKE
jgi:tRNA dimethylallyltransferase